MIHNCPHDECPFDFSENGILNRKAYLLYFDNGMGYSENLLVNLFVSDNKERLKRIIEEYEELKKDKEVLNVFESFEYWDAYALLKKKFPFAKVIETKYEDFDFYSKKDFLESELKIEELEVMP